MPKAYWITTYREIKDPAKLAAYAKLAPVALAPFGVDVHEADADLGVGSVEGRHQGGRLGLAVPLPDALDDAAERVAEHLLVATHVLVEHGEVGAYAQDRVDPEDDTHREQQVEGEPPDEPHRWWGRV